MGIQDASEGRGRTPDIGLADGSESRSSRDSESASPTDDDMFKVLSNRRRRQILEYLRTGTGTATAGELAEHIARGENDTASEQVSSYDRKRVYVSLYQNHLPVMDDANVVDYDENRKTVRLRDVVETYEPYLDDSFEPADNRGSIAAALVVASVVLLGTFQIGVLAAVPIPVWVLFGLGGLVGFVGLATYSSMVG